MHVQNIIIAGNLEIAQLLYSSMRNDNKNRSRVEFMQSTDRGAES